MNHKKQLKLDPTDQKLFGVLSGFADYFDIDVTLLRVLFVLFVLTTGFFPGIVGYFVAWLIMK